MRVRLMKPTLRNLELKMLAEIEIHEQVVRNLAGNKMINREGSNYGRFTIPNRLDDSGSGVAYQ